MTVTALGVDEPARRSECWCCGRIESPEKLAHLGNHPEVAVCVQCAYWLKTSAREIEDRSRTGPAVRFRDRLRQLRRGVMGRGWHGNRLVGRPLRWLGRHLP